MKKIILFLAVTACTPAMAAINTNITGGTIKGGVSIDDSNNYSATGGNSNARGGNSNATGGNSNSSSHGGAGGAGGDGGNSNSIAYGGRSSVGDTKSKSVSGDSYAKTGESTSSVDNVTTGSNNVNIEGDEGTVNNFRRIPANTAIAPSGNNAPFTCFGYAGVAAQGATFGGAIGGSKLDKGCVMQRNINIAINKFDRPDVALAMFCEGTKAGKFLGKYGIEDFCINNYPSKKIDYSKGYPSTCEYTNSFKCKRRN